MNFHQHISAVRTSYLTTSVVGAVVTVTTYYGTTGTVTTR